MMLENESARYFAHVGIQPNGTLSETARVLGDILSINFFDDEKGLYEEFPAFVAEVRNIRFALLGTPAQEDDLRENPTADFELIVQPIRPLSQVKNTDISEDLASIICRDGRLVGWVLK